MAVTTTQTFKIDCSNSTEYNTAVAQIQTWVAWWNTMSYPEVISGLTFNASQRRITFTMTKTAVGL